MGGKGRKLGESKHQLIMSQNSVLGRIDKRKGKQIYCVKRNETDQQNWDINPNIPGNSVNRLGCGIMRGR